MGVKNVKSVGRLKIKFSMFIPITIVVMDIGRMFGMGFRMFGMGFRMFVRGLELTNNK